MKLSQIGIVFALALWTASAASTAAPKTAQDVYRKVQEVQAQMSKISEIPKLMDQFSPLMDAQKFDEADKVVTEALKKIQEFKACK